jgi:RNA polymerase sigma-70 factor, ECF subfamily
MGESGRRLARGDEAALAEVYDACANSVHHYLVLRLGSRDDADDVLQETFVRLVRSRHKLARVDNLTAYVFTVARNEAARLLARKSREARGLAAPDAAMLFREATSDNSHEREAAEALTRALLRLTSEQREIVELKINGGLVLREIAEITGLPPGTVATRYRTAIARLRDWLTRSCHE